jgi:hypothetical protein
MRGTPYGILILTFNIKIVDMVLNAGGLEDLPVTMYPGSH